jgi:hypothetical protein
MDHRPEPRIVHGRMECHVCGRRVYQRLAMVRNSAGQKVGRRIWSHLGWRNTAGLRRANYDRSGGFTL